MVAEDRDEQTLPAMRNETRSLQYALFAFCVLAGASLIVIYLVAPDIYLQTLMVSVRSGDDARPPIVTVFLIAILAFVAFLTIGVLRRWRWVFWLILVAFAFSVLQIPATALELARILPINLPAWYAVSRGLVACVQVAIAIWMIRLYRTSGVWGAGKRAGAPPHP